MKYPRNRNTFHGWTKKFTIHAEGGPMDCYLKIGTLGPDDAHRFPHLSIGDICYLDLTVSKQIGEMRVYEVLMEMASKLIECGGTVDDVADVMQLHEFPPKGVTTDTEIPIAKSICDFVGRYLNRKRKEVDK